jgi:hypothetical protein
MNYRWLLRCASFLRRGTAPSPGAGLPPSQSIQLIRPFKARIYRLFVSAGFYFFCFTLLYFCLFGRPHPVLEGQKHSCVANDHVVVFGTGADLEAIGVRALAAKKCSPFSPVSKAPLAERPDLGAFWGVWLSVVRPMRCGMR